MTPRRSPRHSPPLPAPAGRPENHGASRRAAAGEPAPSRRALLTALAALGASLLPLPALARDGEDDDDNGGGRGRGRGRGGDDRDDSGDRGDDSDRSGHGGGDGRSGGDDHGGSGGGSGPGDGSGNGSGSGDPSSHGGGAEDGSGSGDGRAVAPRVRDVTVIYPDGWVERITGGSYELIDDQSRLVVRRAATPEDASRMLALR